MSYFPLLSGNLGSLVSFLFHAYVRHASASGASKLAMDASQGRGHRERQPLPAVSLLHALTTQSWGGTRARFLFQKGEIPGEERGKGPKRVQNCNIIL